MAQVLSLQKYQTRGARWREEATDEVTEEEQEEEEEAKEMP
jgi:hypothetical protein